MQITQCTQLCTTHTRTHAHTRMHTHADTQHMHIHMHTRTRADRVLTIQLLVESIDLHISIVMTGYSRPVIHAPFIITSLSCTT